MIYTDFNARMQCGNVSFCYFGFVKVCLTHLGHLATPGTRKTNLHYWFTNFLNTFLYYFLIFLYHLVYSIYAELKMSSM